MDESDRLFDEGHEKDKSKSFRSQLVVIYQACTLHSVTRCLFSATFTEALKNWCDLNLNNLVQVYIGTR